MEYSIELDVLLWLYRKKTEAARAAAGGCSSATSNTSAMAKAFKKAASKSPNLPRKPDAGGKGETGVAATATGIAGGGSLGSTVNRAYSGSGTLHPLTSGDESSSVAISLEDLDTVSWFTVSDSSSALPSWGDPCRWWGLKIQQLALLP